MERVLLFLGHPDKEGMGPGVPHLHVDPCCLRTRQLTPPGIQVSDSHFQGQSLERCF